jgi:hypothetical protein
VFIGSTKLLLRALIRVAPTIRSSGIPHTLRFEKSDSVMRNPRRFAASHVRERAMKKSMLEIYSLAICFVTIVCAAVTLGIDLYDLIEISHPEFTLPLHPYERHQTNEAFSQNDCGKDGEFLTAEEKNKTPPNQLRNCLERGIEIKKCQTQNIKHPSRRLSRLATSALTHRRG